ncbi:MAG TPA: hypothetical protein VOB72_03700 [Candidatus Dormibacteraeota bacterium]|nr:hypothetical protein [Candidatus Dormibacteraeota bacterium]
MSTTGQHLQVEVREYPDQDYLGLELDAAPAAIGTSVSAGFSRIFTHLARERTQSAGPPFLIASPPSGDRMHVLVAVPTANALDGSGDLRPGGSPVVAPRSAPIAGRTSSWRRSATIFGPGSPRTGTWPRDHLARCT